MPVYTVVTTRALTGSSTYVIEYADDASVVADAKQVLDEIVVSIAIAQGADQSELRWLGEWRLWNGEPRWLENGPVAVLPASRRSRLRLVHRRHG
jgi:hypothetical protein